MELDGTGNWQVGDLTTGWNWKILEVGTGAGWRCLKLLGVL